MHHWYVIFLSDLCSRCWSFVWLLGFSIVKDRKIANADQTTSGQNGVGAQQNGVGTIIIVLGSLDFYNLHFSFFQMVAM